MKKAKKIFKTLIAGAMACIIALPVNTVTSSAWENKDYDTITGLVNIAAKNEEEDWDYRVWMRLERRDSDGIKLVTTNPKVSDISETMDYCNPLVSKNYYCIDLDGKEYPATTADYEISTLSQVDVLSASYEKYLKNSSNGIIMGNAGSRNAAEQALRISNGYEVTLNNTWNIWTYNGYAPEQSSKHQESMDKWAEARQVLKDFCKENKYVVYGFAFAVPNVN